MMKHRSVRARRRAFTLIEVMMVVGILGILAAIAIPNFLQQALRAKQSEANIIMGSIKTGQLSFSAANDCYAPIPPTPPGPPGAARMAWTAAAPTLGPLCTGAALSFEDLAVRPSGGSVYYSYACTAQILGVSGPVSEFTCSAVGDLDGNTLLYEMLFCSDTDQDGAGIASAAGTACNFPWQLTRVSADLY